MAIGWLIAALAAAIGKIRGLVSGEAALPAGLGWAVAAFVAVAAAVGAYAYVTRTIDEYREAAEQIQQKHDLLAAKIKTMELEAAHARATIESLERARERAERAAEAARKQAAADRKRIDQIRKSIPASTDNDQRAKAALDAIRRALKNREPPP